MRKMIQLGLVVGMNIDEDCNIPDHILQNSASCFSPKIPSIKPAELES
jgi:hypothetical protein